MFVMVIRFVLSESFWPTGHESVCGRAQVDPKNPEHGSSL